MKINNTGVKRVTKLIKVYRSNNVPVLDKNGKIITKNNVIGDPDYVPPVIDYCDCPTPESAPCGPDSDAECSLIDVSFLPISGTYNPDTFMYTFVIGVNDQLKDYQFKNPITGDWNDATIGKNKTSYSIDARIYDEVIVRVRRKGCIEEKIKVVDIESDTPLEPLESTIVVSGYSS